MAEEFVSEPIRYLRKHWFKIATEQSPQMTLYFERQARSKRQSKMRWWLFTIDREKSLG
jgi:hypothetical protein